MGWVVVEFVAITGGIVAPPVDALQELLGDGRGDGALRKEVFSAVNLRRLREDRGAAVADDEVGGITQSRVGGNAGITIRTAAFQRHLQFGKRLLRAAGGVDHRQHGLDLGNCRIDRLAGAAVLLDRHGAQPLTLFHLVMFENGRDLVGFTTEADQQNAAEIRMAGVALNGADQQAVTFRFRIQRTAAAMGQRHDAIDIVETIKAALLVEIIRDVTRNRGGTVHRSDDADIVSCSDATEAAVITLESPAFGFRHHALFFDIDAELMRVFGRHHGEIVQVHVPAGLDILGGDTDDLSVFQHLIARFDELQGHLVPAPDQLERCQIAPARRAAGRNGPTRHCDIVVGVQQNGCLGILTHGFSSSRYIACYVSRSVFDPASLRAFQMGMHGGLRQQRVSQFKRRQNGFVFLKRMGPGIAVFEFHAKLGRNGAVALIEKVRHHSRQNAVTGLFGYGDVKQPILIQRLAAGLDFPLHGIEYLAEGRDCLIGHPACRQHDGCPLQRGARLHQFGGAVTQRFGMVGRLQRFRRHINPGTHANFDGVVDFKRNQRLAQGRPRYTELLCQFAFGGKPRAGQEFTHVDEFAYLIRNLLIKPARFRYFGLTTHVFFDEPCLQFVFGLTVTPSVSIRKELLKYMKLSIYYRLSFHVLLLFWIWLRKFWPNWLDHSEKPA
ncbi:hypothetical protein AGR7C_Cc10070 [Agrobacterium deltaense Zutra 3/1]|uniref:Uncharacterized protein n=1 Tax=Agrobacterium deltaense Zutra 3/1 TaxID=1183427 RepID=A0A1S7NRI8_9HYPH|nr:hypothetical protein AGR7C_Cc10070 [Agrobacterium deltaense Zutra 3/1]